MNKIAHSLRFAIVLLVVFGFQLSCADHDFPSYVCPDADVSYLEDVKPIIEAKCAISGCHNGSLGAERNWSDFATFQENSRNGNIKNYVINRIMPPSSSPNGALTQEQINSIACWVDDGASNN